MTLLEKIKSELFVKECLLVETINPEYYGRGTSNKEVFYFTHQFGYVLYLPKLGVSEMIFDPINPTSFDWHLFNQQIIFVPTTNMPFKTFFKLHPDLNDYIIRFNLEFLKKFRSVWVETDNEKIDYYFLLRKTDKKIVKIMEEIDMIPEEETKIEASNEFVFEFVNVMPAFQRSNTIIKIITEKNLDDIWKHWLLEEHGNAITNQHYRNKYKDEEWVSKVLGELIVKNLTTKYDQATPLDADLRRLLGMSPPQMNRYGI